VGSQLMPAPNAGLGCDPALGVRILVNLAAAWPTLQREEAAEFFNRTAAGGAITLVSTLFMAILFFSELRE
jgi:hypothetical protein